MRICVKLFGHFRDYLPSGSEGPLFWIELEERSRVSDLLTHLGIPEKQPKAIICNHRTGKEGQLLNDGDVVAIFSPVSGG